MNTKLGSLYCGTFLMVRNTEGLVLRISFLQHIRKMNVPRYPDTQIYT